MFKAIIENLVQKAINSLKKKGLLLFDDEKIIVDAPNNPAYGNYSTNIALLLSKKNNKKAEEIAEMIIFELKAIKSIDNYFEKIQIINAFINFTISQKILLNNIREILEEQENYGRKEKIKKIIVIDYSSPNVAKSFGIGHLRSTIIGQAIYNIYKFLGWKVIGMNHLGDWGTQFGKIIVAIKKYWTKNLEDLTIADLEKLYVQFHQEVDNNRNEDLEVLARKNFKLLEDGDEENIKIWQTCIRISLKEFNKIYNLLDVKIDNCLGESFYRDKTTKLIEDAIKNSVAKKSKSALVVPLKEGEVPLMLLKSDGATTYATRDLAALKYRVDTYNPDIALYEVGAEQEFVFRQLFDAAKKMSWFKDKKIKLVHIGHGFYRSKEGKFSTRQGKTVRLKEVLLKGIALAKEIIKERQMSELEKEKIAHIVGIGAIKYNDLSQHYKKDIIFDWGKILSLQGNSAPYIQYTIVRCISILEKNNVEYKKIDNAEGLKLNNEELALLNSLFGFQDAVNEAGLKFSPNLIANYIYKLAKEYSVFYENCSILIEKDKNKKKIRLALTDATQQILKNGLLLLGIESVEKM